MLTNIKRTGCSGMITLMILWDISHQDFLDYIHEQSVAYEEKHLESRLDFDEQTALSETRTQKEDR